MRSITEHLGFLFRVYLLILSMLHRILEVSYFEVLGSGFGMDSFKCIQPSFEILYRINGTYSLWMSTAVISF